MPSLGRARVGPSREGRGAEAVPGLGPPGPPLTSGQAFRPPRLDPLREEAAASFAAHKLPTPGAASS